MSTATGLRNGLPRRRAVAFIIPLGTISLFADTTYEGARSITGPYLGGLGVLYDRSILAVVVASTAL